MSNPDVKNKYTLEYIKKGSVFCVQAQCKKSLLNIELIPAIHNFTSFGLGNTEKIK